MTVAGDRSPRWRPDHRTVERVLDRGLGAFVALVLLFLWLPLCVMVVLSVAENAATLFPFEGLTVAHYVELFTRDTLLASAGRSALIATLSASIATVLGILASFAIVRFEFRYRELFRLLCLLPMLIPGLILGIELLIYFNTVLGIGTGIWTIVLTHSVYGIPFVLLPVSARLYAFDESLEETARDLGADAVDAFVDITLPVLGPAVAAGFLFAWLRSFEDFIRVFFVGGTTSVLTIEMYGLIRFDLGAVLNPLSSLIILAIAALLAVAMNAGNVVGYVADT